MSVLTQLGPKGDIRGYGVLSVIFKTPKCTSHRGIGLGVWYTPTEVVRYMVARVDQALKDDLGIADGLAADNVYVLDPCCGTGAYLASPAPNRFEP